MTVQLYGQFLVGSQVNYTGPYLADHPDGLTHNNVRCFLKIQRFTPRQLWPQVRPEAALSTRGYVLFDDTGLDKHPPQAHRVGAPSVQGQRPRRACRCTGLVTCVYVNPETGQFWRIYYRFFAPDADGKTRPEHVADQLAPRGIAYRTVLMDSWAVTTGLFKWLLQEHKQFTAR